MSYYKIDYNANLWRIMQQLFDYESNIYNDYLDKIRKIKGAEEGEKALDEIAANLHKAIKYIDLARGEIFDVDKLCNK